MDWIKIPTDNILYSEFKGSETYLLIKYQALYCQIEKEPTEPQLKRIFNKAELKFIRSNQEVVQNLCRNQIEMVTKKRKKDKEKYEEKQCVDKNSESGTKAERERYSGADKNRLDKTREEKKINKKIENFYSNDFEKFWSGYPKTNCSKKNASKSFDSAIKKTDIETIMIAIEKYNQYLLVENWQKPQHHTTWLNGECWNNEYQLPLTEAEKELKRLGL